MANIKFYRGQAEYYSATAHANGVYFATDTRSLFVGEKNYGLTDEEAANLASLAESKLIKSITHDDETQQIVITWVGENEPTTTINLLNVIGLASDKNSGLMSSEDKIKVDTMAAALVDSDGKIITATESNAGLMTAAQVILLNSLDGSGSGEGTDAGILTRMAAAEGNITNLQGQVSDLEGQIGDWTSTTETITQAIGGIEGDITTINEDITEINGRLEGLTGAMHFRGTVTALPTYSNDAWSDGETYAAGDVVLFGTKEYVCNDKNAFIEFGDEGSLATQDQVSALENRVKALEDDETSSNNASAIQALQTRVQSLEEYDTNNTTSLDALTSRVAANEGNITAVTEKAGKNETDIAGLTTRVGNLEAYDTNNTTALEALQARVKTLEEDKTNSDAIAALQDRVKVLEDDTTLENHEERITAVEDLLTWGEVTEAPVVG